MGCSFYFQRVKHASIWIFSIIVICPYQSVFSEPTLTFQDLFCSFGRTF